MDSTMNKDPVAVNAIQAKMETLQVPDTNGHCEFIKDGKLHFFEPKLRAENHNTVAEKISFFRQFRAHTENTAEMFQQTIEIPAAYFDLIAALVQDSEEPFTVLTSRVNDILSPFLRNEKVAIKYEVAIEKAIKQIASKYSYGLSLQVFNSIEHTATNIPGHLHISRWEVNDISVLPIDMQRVIIDRRRFRQYMTEKVSSHIFNLPSNERSTIVNTKHRNRSANKEVKEEVIKPKPVETEQEKEEKRLKMEEENKKRQREEEKRKQREEEKRIRTEEKKKREDEKRKKEQSQLRLTSLFQKTTTTHHASPNPVEKTIEPAKPTLFPAFYIKDHVHIAENCSIASSKDSNDNYNQFKKAINTPSNVSIQNFMSEINPESKKKRGVSTHVDIRTLLLPGASDVLQVPNVRLVLRMKLLHFADNVRPAYYGTFTKQSQVVNGRRPFAQDVEKLNYDVDSEAEWEPEGEGEDIHSGDEDDEDPADLIDPEDAGWLVPEGYLSDNEGVEEGDRSGKATYPRNASKRLVVRKIVLGPFFEGDAATDDELLQPFETQFLVNIPDEGFNPFYKEPVTRVVHANTVPDPNPPAPAPNKNEFTDEHTNALISVINEKASESIPNLVNEAKANSVLKDVSKRLLATKIKNIAVKEKRGTNTKLSWYVKDPSAPAVVKGDSIPIVVKEVSSPFVNIAPVNPLPTVAPANSPPTIAPANPLPTIKPLYAPSNQPIQIRPADPSDNLSPFNQLTNNNPSIPPTR